MPEQQQSVLDAFEAPNAVQLATEQIEALAEEIALGDAELSTLKDQVKAKENQIKDAQKALYNLLASAGLADYKCPCGLWPHTKINVKVFKAGGVADSDLFEWLNNHGMGDIIKPAVHWGTLSSAMKEYEEAGNEIDPAMFNKVEEPVITMTGKSKYLAKKLVS